MSVKLAGRRALLRQLGLLLLPACAPINGWASPALRITMANLMPWSDQAGAAGVLVELARSIERRSGQVFEIAPLPYARALTMLEQGSVDLMLAVQSDRLDHIANCVAAVSDAEITVLVRHGMTVNTLADLSGKRVGHLRFADYDPAFAAATDIRKYEFNSYNQGLRMLKIGRLDALVAIRSAIQYTLKNMGLPPAQASDMLPLRRATVALYQSKRSHSNASVKKDLVLACANVRRENQAHILLSRLLAD